MRVKKKKVVFLINSCFPYISGGRETWLYNISKQLVAKGYSINIITQKNSGNPLFFNDISDLIEITTCKTLSNIPLFKPAIRSYFRIINSLILTLQMTRVIKNKYTGIYSNYVFISMDTIFTALSVGIIKKNKDIKFICSDRGRHAVVLSTKLPLLKKIFFYIEKWAYMTASEIWANGIDTKDYIKNRGFKSILIKNGVNIKRIDQDHSKPDENLFNSDEFIVTNVATLLDIKGIKECIEAAKLLGEWGETKFRFVFVGKGSSAKYKAYAEKLNVIDKVVFLGEQKNVIPYLKESDVLVCLSGGGGMSMSALEALASQTPVIAWKSEIYEQIIQHEVNGILVKEKNPDELAKAIKKIMNNYSKYKSMGKTARISIESNCWEKITEKVVERIEKI